MENEKNETEIKTADIRPEEKAPLEVSTADSALDEIHDEQPAALVLAAINGSIAHSEVVSLCPADNEEFNALCDAFSALCEGSTITGDTANSFDREFWGTTENLESWRVRVWMGNQA